MLWSMQVSRTCYVCILVYFQIGFHSVFWHFLGHFLHFISFFAKKFVIFWSFFWLQLSGQPDVCVWGHKKCQFLGKFCVRTNEWTLFELLTRTWKILNYTSSWNPIPGWYCKFNSTSVLYFLRVIKMKLVYFLITY